MPDLLTRLRDALRDRYEIDREAGRGGMATVYLARDLKHGREVAIKVLSPDLAASVGHERFLREIEIAAKLQHPHILPVYDSGEAGGLLYYVMPFVQGESLRERLATEGPLPPLDATRLAGEIAGALDFAHRQGIVHRDIKPANILISDGHAVVADFGIARAISVSGTAGLTQAGMAIGTPSYMSPEQALGETELDGRTDVYALGCVLFEMLAGNPPYEGTTPQAIVAQAISGEIPTLPTDPLRVQPVIARAMAKEPANRFQTANDMRLALQTGTTAPIPAATRRRLIGTIAAVAVLAVISAVLLRPRGYRVDGDPRQSVIVFPFENKTADPDKDYLQDASMNLLGLAIGHWEDVRVFDDERTNSLMRRRGAESPRDLDFDAAQAMAREARVGTLVLGDIRREGDSLAVEAKVHDVASGVRIATEIVRAGFDADPRPLFDAVAARILQVSGAPASERPDLVTQTTHSIEAYRAYLRGVEALQLFAIDSARANFLQAVTIDSTFALAYLRLRDAEGWAGIDGSPERSREWITKAQAHASGLPPRLRTLLQFHIAYENGEFARARALVEGLIARDSTDVEAWYQLGEAHFHDVPSSVPPPADGPQGNIGKALRAFQRTLAVDSGYTLAYQHVLDALGRCANGSSVLCMADSAVYAPPGDLSAAYGDARIASLRADARADRIATTYAWVEAAPLASRARGVLIGFLVDENRIDEARLQVATLRTQGEITAARLWDARLGLRAGAYGSAADSLTAGMEDAANMFRLLTSGGDGPAEAFAIFAAGGRLAQMALLIEQLTRLVAGSGTVTAVGPGNVPMPIPVLAGMMRFSASAAIGADPAAVRRSATAYVSAIDSLFPPGDPQRDRVFSSSGSLLLAAYLVSRDTTMLSRFIAAIDTTGSRTWRSMDAHLALQRGDTAHATMRLERNALRGDSLEFLGEPGAVRAMAWADLLTQLGELERAIEIYQHLDQPGQRLEQPSLHVRSLAERGALYQRLDDTTRAIEMYEGFVEAWEHADEALQPLVERARAAVAALRGEPYPAPERR